MPSTQEIHRIFAKGVADAIQRRVDAFRLKLISDRVAYASKRGRLRDKHIATGASYVEAGRLASMEMDGLGRVFPKSWDDNADASAYRAKLEQGRPMSEAPRSGFYPNGQVWSKDDRDNNGVAIPCPPFGTLIVVKREDRVFGGIKYEPMVWQYGAWSRHRMEGVFFDTNPTLLCFYTFEDLGL